jgi:hypothetical protein
MTKIDVHVDSLQTKLKQLKVRQQRIDHHELDHDTLQAWLDPHLTRPDDRALSDLPPRSPA